jgi:alkanesulfonate monooxygenase SsuD/methylene tetrahydromethanopterin reductase-like flavin-dependent oxidoreductase (luciferase family)
VQKRLPILIGGGGEQRTLRTTARYADMWHGFGTTEQMAHKLDVLRKHCEDVGRDPNDITPFAGKWCVIRDDPAEAKKVLDRVTERHGMTSPPEPFIGEPDAIAEKIAAYWKVGIKGFIIAFADPFDTESIERLGTEVRPRLKELTSETPAAVSR